MRKDPTDSTRLHAHPQVVDIFTRESWVNFFEKFGGFDDEIAQEFSLSLVPHTRTHATIIEDVGHMEEKLREMGKELSALRDKEAIRRSHLETENELLRRQLLQEKETQLACMAILSMEAL